MSKKSANTAALIKKVCKRKEEVKNLRKPPEERDQPIPPSQVHETPKKNPKHDRKQSKELSRKIMHGEYE